MLIIIFRHPQTFTASFYATANKPLISLAALTVFFPSSVERQKIIQIFINIIRSDFNGCASIHCLFGAECFASRGQAPSCRCPELRSCGGFSGSDVTASSRVVCGSNLVTYLSECHLRVASCVSQSPIGIKLYGPCGRCTASLQLIMMSLTMQNH